MILYISLVPVLSALHAEDFTAPANLRTSKQCQCVSVSLTTSYILPQWQGRHTYLHMLTCAVHELSGSIWSGG